MANCIRCGRQLSGFTFGKKICSWCAQHEAAQRGELADDARQPVIRTPWRTPGVRHAESNINLTQVIFGINVAVFIAMGVQIALGKAPEGSSIMDFGSQVMQWGANWGPLTLSGEWWRLLTCVFVHGGLIHIAFNMWCLWNLGQLAEMLYGRWTYGAIYLICGVGASLATVFWHFQGPSVGASGAIFGLAGALLAAFKLGEFSVPRAALSGTLRSLGAFVVYNLIFGFALPGIDNAAHIGGLITGLIVGALVAVMAPRQEDAPRRIAIFVVLTLALTGGAIGLARYHRIPLRLGRVDFGQADSTLSENNPANVIAQYQKIVRDKPKFVPGHIALAKAYMRQGQFDPAEKELKRALQLDPRSAEARLVLGMVYLNQDRPQDAQSAFSQVLTQDSKIAEAHFGLGLALAAEHNDQAAIDEYKTADGLAPEAAGIEYNLGLSFAKLKMFDDAIAAFQKERQQSGDNADIEEALADSFQAKGQTQQADDARQKAAELRKRATDR